MLTPEEKEKVIKKYKFWRLKNNFISRGRHLAAEPAEESFFSF